MSNHQLHDSRPLVAQSIRRLAVPIVLGWLAITVFVSIGIPSLEQVERERAVSLTPGDAPSFAAADHMVKDFKEANSETALMVVLEGQQPLAEAAHRYYNRLITQFEGDAKHVQHIQNFWGDPLTAGAAQSADGKAAYVQLDLVGHLGSAQANQSAEAVRDIVARTPPPPGIEPFVTGSAAIASDMGRSGEKTVLLVTAVSLAVIFIMLLFVYRSIITVILILLMVWIELQVARGIVAFLGYHQIVGLSTYVVNLLVSIVIAAGTDYANIFHWAVSRGASSRRGSGNGLLHYIPRGRSCCVGFGRHDRRGAFLSPLYPAAVFPATGVPCAVGILVAVAVALTLTPAIMALGGRFGLFDRKRAIKFRGWRRVGTAIVRWPAPILAATVAVALIGLLMLPGYKPGYSDQKYIPKNIPANLGYAAVARHFPSSRMMAPEILLVEADHDLRNSADFLVLEKLAKAVFAVQGISNVQSDYSAYGRPYFSMRSIPFMLSMQQAAMQQNMSFQKDRMSDMLKQAEELDETIAIMQRMYALMQQISQRRLTTWSAKRMTWRRSHSSCATTLRISKTSGGRSGAIFIGISTAPVFRSAFR